MDVCRMNGPAVEACVWIAVLVQTARVTNYNLSVVDSEDYHDKLVPSSTAKRYGVQRNIQHNAAMVLQ